MSINNIDMIKLIFTYFEQYELLVYSLKVNNKILTEIVSKFDFKKQFFQCCKIGWNEAIDLIGMTDENILEEALPYITENEDLDRTLGEEKIILDQMFDKGDEILWKDLQETYSYSDEILKVRRDNILIKIKNKISKRIDYKSAFLSAVSNKRANTLRLLKYWFIEDWRIYDDWSDFNYKFPMIYEIFEKSIESGFTKCVLELENVLIQSASGMGWQGMVRDSDNLIQLCGIHRNIEIFEILYEWFGLHHSGLFRMGEVAASLGNHDIIIHTYKKYAWTEHYSDISLLINEAMKYDRIETVKALSKLTANDMGSTPEAFPKIIRIGGGRKTKITYS
jgi:hypothetical protein